MKNEELRVKNEDLIIMMNETSGGENEEWRIEN
jgi:hypothetical protein